MQITHTISIDTLGDTTPEHAEGYRAALEARLCELYPDAEIEVLLTSKASCSATQTTNADDVSIRDQVNGIANDLWDRQSWV